MLFSCCSGSGDIAVAALSDPGEVESTAAAAERSNPLAAA